MLRNQITPQNVTLLSETKLLLQDFISIFRDTYKMFRDHILHSHKIYILEAKMNGVNHFSYENHLAVERLENNLDILQRQVQLLMKVLDQKQNATDCHIKTVAERLTTHIEVLQDEIDARF